VVLSRQHVACASSLLNARSSRCCRLLDCSYELGSGKVHEDGSGSGGSGGATGSIANTELEGEVGRVREDLVKIQEMLLLFSERLAQLEQGAAATTDSSVQHDLDETQLLKGSRGHAKRRRKDKK
jgi:hypothetical protein